MARQQAHSRLTHAVDVTPIFSLRENAIAEEPELSYPECYSFESSPYVTLSRGGLSASSLVTPIR
jgi:hypothetical protein